MAYQFKITLQEVQPPIWRRFTIPKTATMADFSFAIEDSMKWSGTCLHRFIVERSIPLPDYENSEYYDVLEDIPLSDYIKYTLEYEYKIDNEIGDGWMHTIELEGEVDCDLPNPVCLEGERNCPPERMKGYADAYREFLDVVMDKEHPDREWVLEDNLYDETDFDPEEFDKETVRYRKYVQKGARKIYWD